LHELGIATNPARTYVIRESEEKWLSKRKTTRVSRRESGKAEGSESSEEQGEEVVFWL
jgi:hypothetical protein